MRAEPSLTVISLGGGVQSTVMALMAGQSLPPTGSRGPLTECRTAPSSPTPAGSRPASTSTWSGLPGNSASALRSGQRAQPPRGREGPHQPLRLPELRGHTRLPEGKERGGRRHRPPPVHRQLQDQAHQTQDTRPARPETPTASPRRNHRRAVAGNLHRRGHPHEGLPRQVDGEPLSPHRGGHIPKRLLGLVGSPLRQASGTLGLRRLPLPIPPTVGGDQAQMAGLFAEAVEIDARLRGLAFAKEPYLHTVRMPLAEAVALDEAELGTDGQRDGFGNECEGHCGV